MNDDNHSDGLTFYNDTYVFFPIEGQREPIIPARTPFIGRIYRDVSGSLATLVAASIYFRQMNGDDRGKSDLFATLQKQFRVRLTRVSRELWLRHAGRSNVPPCRAADTPMNLDYVIDYMIVAVGPVPLAATPVMNRRRRPLLLLGTPATIRHPPR